MTDVLMPRLSDSMEEGTILKWLVSEGDEVKRGQPIAEIETDKANMTYEVDTDGTISELVASEGDTLAIGEVIARVGDAYHIQEITGGFESPSRHSLSPRIPLSRHTTADYLGTIVAQINIITKFGQRNRRGELWN